MTNLMRWIRRWWRRVAVLMLVIAAAALWFLIGNFIVLWPVERPQDPQTAAIDETELSTHVHFLAQPALKGRLPLSMGSRIARGYIEDRFTACGLKPWGDAREFNQPFNLGTNVVGVLPGSDPALADEFVLLTAHYDHLGFGHLGACDDASGVAALLEIAEALTNANPRPRRSVAFAAFDCEEVGLIGGYAFSLREDVQRSRIRAVINMDMLGRRFLDLLDNAVIVAGTEFYPQTRATVLAEGDAQSIRVHPAGLDLAGARGDHVAFLNLPRTGAAEALGPPAVLFFTNGTFDDYHEKGDRAERMDYGLLTRSARLIEKTAVRLANDVALESRTPGPVPDPAELDVFRAVGAEVLRQEKKLALTGEQRAAAQSWLRQAEACAAKPGYCTEDRQDLIQKLATLGPSVDTLLAKAIGGGNDRLKDGDLRQIAGTGEMWRRYGVVFDQGFREFVGKLLQHSAPSLILRGMPDEYQLEQPFVTAEDITVDALPDGQRRLSFMYTTPVISAGLYSFGRAGIGMGVYGEPIEFRGSHDEMVDFCILLAMNFHSTKADVEWAMTSAKPGSDAEERRAWLESQMEPRYTDAVDKGSLLLLETVTGEPQGDSIEAFIDRHARQQGFPDRDAWLLGVLDSPHPRLVFAAGSLLNRRKPDRHTEAIRAAYVRILEDPQMSSWRRAQALHILSTDRHKESLRCLVPYLEDKTVVIPLPDPIEDESSPLHHHPVVRYSEEEDSGAKEAEGESTVTLGEVALYELKKASGQKMGPDRDAWLKWTGDRFTVLKDACGCHRPHRALRTRGLIVWQAAQ